MQDAISIGDTFRTTIEVMQRNLATLGAMVFVIACFSFGATMGQGVLMSAVMPGMVPGDDPMAALSGLALLVPFLLVVMVVSMVVYAVVQAGMTYAAVEHMAGRTTDPVTALGTAVRSIFGLIAVQLIIGVVVAMLLLACVVPGALVGVAAESPLIGGFVSFAGMMFGLLVGAVVALQYCVVMPVVVVERLGPLAALSRSSELTRGSRVNIFLVFLVYAVCVFALSACVLGPVYVAVLGGMMASGDPAAMSNPLHPLMVAYQGVNSVFSACLSAIGTSLVAVIYARLRGIRDGLDAAAFAQVFA